ncbi:MAG TPA: peroxiredoxin-like family protein [Polyangiaceae bacterium]|nr:peroxiredoxin-like family protein [Polyangiaceae bacterium]
MSSDFPPPASHDTDRVVTQIAVAHVLALDGKTHRMRDLWGQATTITTFVRHFGCLFCHQMVGELAAYTPRILERGARIVIVGNGTLEQARHFFSEKKLPRQGVAVVTDPRRESYGAAGLERGVARTLLHPGAIAAYGAATLRGHRVNGLFGDLTQLGGMFVIKPPATLLYAHRSRFAGDHPDLDRVLSHLP